MTSFMKIKSKSISGTMVDLVALFLTLTGFVLVFLSVLSNQTIHLKSLYFVKVTQVVPADSQFSITLGMYNYCILQEGNNTLCTENDSLMIAPYDVNIANIFNTTYPELFLNNAPQDPDTDPLAKLAPSHNPRIYAASVLCLLTSGASIVLCVVKLIYRRRRRTSYNYYFDDIYFNRGFLVAGSAVCALLLVCLCSAIYADAVSQLNLTYPNIVSILGPCVPMIGVSFMVFFIASMILLRGCSATIEKSEKFSDEYTSV